MKSDPFCFIVFAGIFRSPVLRGEWWKEIGDVIVDRSFDRVRKRAA